MLNRRTMLKTSAVGGVAFLTLGTTACPFDKPRLSFWVSTIIGTMEELKPLLPNLSESLSKGISIAKSFNEAYQAGKFDSAEKLLENLHGVISQIITDAGANLSDTVKIALALMGVGLRTIAVLLKAQVDSSPQIAAAVKDKAAVSAESARRVSLLDSLANTKEVNALFEASRP